MAKKKCKYTFNGKEYTEDEFKALLASGELAKLQQKWTADSAVAQEKIRSARNVAVEKARQGLKSKVEGYELGFAKGAKTGAKAQEQMQSQLNTAINEFLKDKSLQNVSTAGMRKIMEASQNVRSVDDLMEFDDVVNEVVYGAEIANLMRIEQRRIKAKERKENQKQKREVAYAKKAQAVIKRKIKKPKKGEGVSVFTSDREILKEFVKLDPRKVSDAAEYNMVANAIKENLSNARVRDQEVVKGGRVISNDEIVAYTNKEAKYIEQKEKERLAKENPEMDWRDIDKLSLDEVKDRIKEQSGENLEPADREEKRQVLVEAVKEKIAALEDMKQPDEDGRVAYDEFTKIEKEVFDNIQKLDPNDLTYSQVNSVNNIIENILTNEDFSNAGWASNLYIVQNNIKLIEEYFKKHDITAYKNLGKFKATIASLDLLTEFITNNTKAAAQLQTLTGLQDIASGFSNMNKWMDENLFNPRDQMLKKAGRRYTQFNNVAERGMYAFMIQTKSEDAAVNQLEFDRRKILVIKSINELKAAEDKDAKKRGEALQGVYDKILKDASSAAEIKVDPINKGIVDLHIEKFKELQEQLDENSRIYNNNGLELWNDYTATGYENIDGNLTAEELGGTVKELQGNNFIQDRIRKEQAGTTKERLENWNLPKDKVINFNFDNLQERKMRESLYEIYTQKYRQQFSETEKNEKFRELIGGKKNAGHLKKAAINMINAQMRLTNPDPLAKSINKIVNILTAKGTRVALGSIDQVVKQGVPVAFNTMINLNTDLHLLFTTPGWVSINDNIFSQSSLRERKDTRAGTRYSPILDDTERAKIRSVAGEALNFANERIAEPLSKAAMWSLTSTDYWIARKSWLAYYAKYIKDTRGGKIDWEKEVANPDKDASAYAEQMISRSQNVNDYSKQSDLLRRDGGYKDIMKNILMPFSSFSINQRARMILDFQKIRTGIWNLNAEQIEEAYYSLGATVAETVIFSAVKLYVLALVGEAMKDAVLAMCGVEDEPEDEKDENEKMYRLIGETSVNLIGGGFGSLAETQMKLGYNAIMGGDYIKIYSPGDDAYDFGQWGSYGIVLGKAQEIYQIADMVLSGQFEVQLGKGETTWESLDPGHRRVLNLYFWSTILSVVGVSEGTVNTAISRAKQVTVKQIGRYAGGERTFTTTVKGKRTYTKNDSAPSKGRSSSRTGNRSVRR